MFRAVPDSRREAAAALGATRWEVIRLAVLNGSMRGIFGAAMLGLGRALGETMAVTMVIGNSPDISVSLFAPGYTLASAIANEFTEADDRCIRGALFELGLVLLLVTIAANILAHLLVGAVSAPKDGGHVNPIQNQWRRAKSAAISTFCFCRGDCHSAAGSDPVPPGARGRQFGGLEFFDAPAQAGRRKRRRHGQHDRREFRARHAGDVDRDSGGRVGRDLPFGIRFAGAQLGVRFCLDISTARLPSSGASSSMRWWWCR